FICHRLRPGSNCSSGGVRHAEILQRYLHRSRDNVDDATVSFLLHRRNDGFGENMIANEVLIECLEKRLFRRVDDGSAGRTSRVVDENVYRMRRNVLTDHFTQLIGSGKIADEVTEFLAE